MGYTKIGSTFVIFIIFVLLFSYSYAQEFTTKEFLSQNYIKYKDIKNKIRIFTQNLDTEKLKDTKSKNSKTKIPGKDLDFEKLYENYITLYTKHPLVKKSKTLYVSILPYLRPKILAIMNKMADKYKKKVNTLINEYLHKNNFTEIIKLLLIIPPNTAYSEIWIKVLTVYLEEGDCYKIKYIFDKFNIKIFFPKLYLLGKFCLHQKVTQYPADYDFERTELPIKGGIELFENLNINPLENRRTFFANYGFIKYNNYLLFYNGNSLYKLSFEKDKVSIDKILDGPDTLDKIYSYEYTSYRKEYIVSFREAFNILSNKSHIYLCHTTEKEGGISKIVARNNIFIGNIAYTIPMKYPRLFRNFIIYNPVTNRIDYFFSGQKKKDSYEKFSCQHIYKLSKKFLLIGGVFGEKHETFSHNLLKFDVNNRNIVWTTYITSGFMERNLFGNPVYESWAHPLSCNNTFCISVIDLGAVVSIDHATGSINWFISLPSYKFKATLTPTHFDRLPYFTENNPPIIDNQYIFVQTLSNPNIYKISFNNHNINTTIFEGNNLRESDSTSDTTLGFDIPPYSDTPRFFYKYKTYLFLIYDLYLKVKNIQTNEEIYRLSFLSQLSGKPHHFLNLLLIPLYKEIIILSLENLKVLYNINTQNHKFICSYYSGNKLYILFTRGLWVINIKNKKGGK